MTSDDEILATVAQLLSEQGVRDFHFVVRGAENLSGNDAARVPDGGLTLEVKHVRPTSIDDVLGILAVGILASRQNASIAIPLLIFKRLGDKTRQAVRQFMSTRAPGCGWGLVDHSGAAQLVVPALNLDVEQRGQIARTSWPHQRPMRLFSDLNQWMLKILLLADTSPSLWGGPRQSVATPTELHRVAGVSVEKAHQFVRAFEQIGLVHQTRRGLALVSKKALLDMWFHEERSRGSRRMPVRWIFGEPASLEQVFSRRHAPSDFAVCGFEACRLLGVLHAPVMNREVYFVGDPDAALADWDLEACDDRDAHLYLRLARSAQSILRGRVVKENVPVVDVLQAAIDVSNQPARGTEQARYIIDHVLGWSDGE